MYQNPNEIGTFRGTTLLQRRGEIGGVRSVFVKIKGLKNEFVYPTFGAIIKNPFKQVPAKMYAGDLMEFRLDKNGVKPELYLLKTFEVAASASGVTTVKIKRDAYRHVPCVGDKLGAAPTKIGGAITELTVTAVVEANDPEAGGDVWELTVGSSATFAPNTILVEGDGSGHMLVKNINAFADSDMDFVYAPASNVDNDFDNARYMYTPAIGGATMYIHKMSPMPKCVLDLNASRMNGWYSLPSIG